MGQIIQLTSRDGVQIPAYQAGEAAQAKAGIVVMQEIFGVNGHIRKVADFYASQGYFVIAPHMFHRVGAGTELGYTQEDMQRGFALKGAAENLLPAILGDVQAAIDEAAQGGKFKVGIVGYCWGGLMSWRAAQRLKGLAASAPYYGGGMHKELDLPLQCPTMAHLSDCDDYVPMAGVAELQAKYPQASVHLYSARHGFNCDERAAFQLDARDLARARTLSFFAQYLSNR